MALPRRVRDQINEFLEEQARNTDAEFNTLTIGPNGERRILYDSQLDTLVVTE